MGKKKDETPSNLKVLEFPKEEEETKENNTPNREAIEILSNALELAKQGRIKDILLFIAGEEYLESYLWDDEGDGVRLAGFASLLKQQADDCAFSDVYFYDRDFQGGDPNEDDD
jgi:hypothetical protein